MIEVKKIIKQTDELLLQIVVAEQLFFGLEALTHQQLTEIAKDNQQLLLCLVDTNKLVGYIYGIYNQVTQSADLMKIQIIATKQKQGYGKALFAAFTNELRQKHIDELFIEVRESNTKAISFYQKNHCQYLGKRKSFYIAPQEDALVYKKII